GGPAIAQRCQQPSKRYLSPVLAGRSNVSFPPSDSLFWREGQCLRLGHPNRVNQLLDQPLGSAARGLILPRDRLAGLQCSPELVFALQAQLVSPNMLPEISVTDLFLAV